MGKHPEGGREAGKGGGRVRRRKEKRGGTGRQKGKQAGDSDIIHM